MQNQVEVGTRLPCRPHARNERNITQLFEYKRSKNAADDTGVSSLHALVFALLSRKNIF